MTEAFLARGDPLLALRPSPIPLRGLVLLLRDAPIRVKDGPIRRMIPSPSWRNTSVRNNGAPAKRSTEGLRVMDASSELTG
jgi:hypothetical protein